MLIEELFRLVRLFFMEKLSPCTFITDCTFIRDLRVDRPLVYSAFLKRTHTNNQNKKYRPGPNYAISVDRRASIYAEKN